MAPVRVLVADDDRVVSAQLCGILRAAGYSPMPVFDSIQAIMFAMRDPSPNAIILDVNMPGGTGLETLRKLRMSAKTMHIPVLVVTGGTDPNVAETAAEIGADDFLRKPIEPDALREAMVKLVPPPPAKR